MLLCIVGPNPVWVRNLWRIQLRMEPRKLAYINKEPQIFHLFVSQSSRNNCNHPETTNIPSFCISIIKEQLQSSRNKIFSMEGEQEQQQVCCRSTRTSCGISDFLQLPLGKFPWLVTYNPDEEKKKDRERIGQIFTKISPGQNQQQQQHYHCQFSDLRRRRRIVGCSHGGWLLLSKSFPSYDDIRYIQLYLWNPVTKEFINLPTLELRMEWGDYGVHIDEIILYFLSSPPGHHDSTLVLLRRNKRNIVFYPLSNKRIKQEWSELSYENELDSISNLNGDMITRMVACNGRIYASTEREQFIQVDINTLVEQNVLNLSSLGRLPTCNLHPSRSYPIGNCDELFAIHLCFMNRRFEIVKSVKLFKLDFSTMTWNELKNAKGRSFFLILGNSGSQISCVSTESESRTWIHIIQPLGGVYSYSMEDKIMSLSSLPCPDLPMERWQEYTSTWIMPENSSLVVDHGESNARSNTNKEPSKEEVEVRLDISSEVDRTMNEELREKMMATTITDQAPLLRFPLHILGSIAEQCRVERDYLNFRATCNQCRLAVPVPWISATSLRRLQTYSPWLMVVDEEQGVTTFTDPKFGDKYFMKLSLELIGHFVICSSKYGWILIYRGGSFGCPFFFNPFTKATIQLPVLGRQFRFFSSFAFSQPPSPACVVAGFAFEYSGRAVLITSPGKSEWRAINIDGDIRLNRLSYNGRTFFGEDICILTQSGELGALRFDEDYKWEIVVDEPPETFKVPLTNHFLVECGNDLLLIIVAHYGQWVEVFRLDQSVQQWEKVDDIGEYMICICDNACFSVVAKISGMENKIYFSRFRDGNVVFYSLDTCKLHICGSNNKNEETLTDFFSTEQHVTSIWIEPSWYSSQLK